MSVAVASQLRTAAWYGDLPLDLDLPENWDVTWHWPQFAPPLSNREIVEALDHPTDQLPIRDLCRGKHKPLIIVDDLNRPTPCSRVLPYIFGAFKAAAIEEQYITILVATGTHAAPGIEAVMRKLGESARRSRIV